MNQVNRREFLKYSSVASASALAFSMTPTALLANNTNAKTLPYTSMSTHVLNRISFGVNQASRQEFDMMGYIDYIDYQLDADNIDDSELEDFIAQNFITVNLSFSEIRALVQSEEITQFQAAYELRAATFLRAVYSKKQLFQVMVEFWNNHFSVFHFDGPIDKLKTIEDREVMRPFALSTFSEILHADATSPAMVYYLDTYTSTKQSPNENYARELMELHTLGVDGPFMHHDIDEVARCFTGWTIQNTGDFTFYQFDHDNDEKTVLGQTIAAGGGITDGEQVLDILAAQDATAEFISTKLCQHFIADTPDKSIVKSTTEVFKSTSGDIKQCLRHILLSKHFLISRDMKLKRPFNYMVSVVRSINADVLNTTAPRFTQFFLESLGHLPFAWQTPDGYPDFASHWEGTTGILFRWNYVNYLSYQEIPGYSYILEDIINEPHTAENVLTQIKEKLIHREMNSTDESALLSYLIDGSSNNVVSQVKIQGAIAIALDSPYFQLS